MTTRETIEQFLIQELLRKNSNIKLVRRLLERQDKKTIIDEFLQLLSRNTEEQYVPVCIFSIKQLGALEALVKYLKEELQYPNRRISGLLSKSQQAVWTSYNHANKKHPARLRPKASAHDIPLSELRHKQRSVLGNVAFYLKERQELSIAEISKLLHKDSRTVWATYRRTKK